MATSEEQATAFKNEGNKAFMAHDWPKAIELYTKALELNDKEPTFYSNRAQVCLPTTSCPSMPHVRTFADHGLVCLRLGIHQVRGLRLRDCRCDEGD